MPKSHFSPVHVEVCGSPNIWPCIQWTYAYVRKKRTSKELSCFSGFLEIFGKQMYRRIQTEPPSWCSLCVCALNERAFIRISVFIHFWICTTSRCIHMYRVARVLYIKYTMFACEWVSVRTYLYVYIVLVEYSISFTLQTIGLVRVSVCALVFMCLCYLFFFLFANTKTSLIKLLFYFTTRRRRNQAEKCGAQTHKTSRSFTCSSALTSIILPRTYNILFP